MKKIPKIAAPAMNENHLKANSWQPDDDQRRPHSQDNIHQGAHPLAPFPTLSSGGSNQSRKLLGLRLFNIEIHISKQVNMSVCVVGAKKDPRHPPFDPAGACRSTSPTSFSPSCQGIQPMAFLGSHLRNLPHFPPFPSFYFFFFVPSVALPLRKPKGKIYLFKET